MLRELTARPNPCSRRWVTVMLRVEPMDGLRSFRNPVVLSLELLKPNETVVPLRKLWDTVALAKVLEVTSVLVPVTKVLVWGLVACPVCTKLVMTGSRLGIVEPVCEITVPLLELAPPAWLAALVEMPVACPPCAGALDGPWLTPDVAPRSRPPAWPRRMPTSAICAPDRRRSSARLLSRAGRVVG